MNPLRELPLKLVKTQQPMYYSIEEGMMTTMIMNKKKIE